MERELIGTHRLLRVFMGESDKSGHEPLYWDIVKRARKTKVWPGARYSRGLLVLARAALSTKRNCFISPLICRSSSRLWIPKSTFRSFWKKLNPCLGARW